MELEKKLLDQIKNIVTGKKAIVFEEMSDSKLREAIIYAGTISRPKPLGLYQERIIYKVFKQFGGGTIEIYPLEKKVKLLSDLAEGVVDAFKYLNETGRSPELPPEQ